MFFGRVEGGIGEPNEIHEPQTLYKIYRLTGLAETTLAANARALIYTFGVAHRLTSKRLFYESQPPRSTHYNCTPTLRLALL